MHLPQRITIPRMVSKESWEQEFTIKRAIPSSTRTEPTKALVLFSEILNLSSPMRVLDAGAGNGRNAIYLATRGCDVAAVDFSEFAVEETRRRAIKAGVTQRVSVVRHFINGSFPFPEEAFDFALDSYVFCHFLNEEAGHRFWSDMARVTKRDGHLLSIVFSTEDDYYSRFLKDSPDGSLVYDPANGIWKRLYTEVGIKSFFASHFDITYFAKFEFFDVVLGQTYRRVVLTSVLKKQFA
jgi:SAM-dependent methyltransferase